MKQEDMKRKEGASAPLFMFHVFLFYPVVSTARDNQNILPARGAHERTRANKG
jgi:hypothetical protein